MDEFDQVIFLALGGGGIMNIIVGLVTQTIGTGPALGSSINYILGGFLLGMLAMKLAKEPDSFDNSPTPPR